MSDLAQTESAGTAALQAPREKVNARLAAWVPLAMILAMFIAVSIVYNVMMPLYEAPDEVAHGRYVKSIATDGELPRFRSSLEYESWQPPLYYATGAAVLKVLDLDSPAELAWNPNFPSEVQYFVHTSNEDFPYSGPVLSIHILRAISTLFSAGTIIFIYLIAVLIFPKRRMLSLTAAATASLIPQFAFISATMSNDAPSFFFATATAYFGLRHLREMSMNWLILAALALSLGALTKLSVLVTGTVPLGAVMIQSNSWRQKLTRTAVFAVFPLVIAGWFYLRSVILWGAVFPDHLFYSLDPHPIWHDAYRRLFFEQLRDSFWYAGGQANVLLSPTIYDVLDFVSALALAGMIVTFASSRLAHFEKRAVILLAVLPVLALGMLLYYSVAHDFQTQGRYLFVAMPAFAILMPFGLSALWAPAKDRDHPSMLALPLLLLAINVWNFTVTLPRYY